MSSHSIPQSSVTPSSARPAPEAAAPRVDMYGPPHKMLRFMLGNLLVQMGATSFGDEAQAASTRATLEMALWACDSHIEHEDRHVRPALVERAPMAVGTLDTEHAEHVQQVAELRALAGALGKATSASERQALGQTLYLHYSVFVAETLAHMAYEERVVQPLLERLFTPAELQAIEGAILASIAPQEMMTLVRYMVPALNREERAGMLGGMKANARLRHSRP